MYTIIFYGMLSGMPTNREVSPDMIPVLYARFRATIAELDCGQKCAPYNENGVPFCCDTRHAVPTAYQDEWRYLKGETNLWRTWEGEDAAETERLQAQTPAGQVLIACLGHEHCQRNFRALTCRAFPFFPYITSQGDFIGLSYYWEYEDRCWVISNLEVVEAQYRAEFVAIYDKIFELLPEERENFKHHSDVMRQVFGKQRRTIPVLHRNGAAYKISPKGERMRRVPVEALPKFGPYAIAAMLPFPDETGR